MKTIAQEFQSFLEGSFPDQPTPGTAQYQQLRMAFFAGALIGAVVPTPLPYLTEALDYLEQFQRREGIHEAHLPN
jgi:hypothetical protein